ncbi:MAG: response regulator [Deltaproteobacteria bacterium]|nr:MAG: response regulator [Deltaproteobacteria bacterium]
MAKILVVDDEPDILRVVVKIMESRGHTVTTAKDGVRALELAESEQPDVVILDVNLPKKDGFEVCRELKSRESTQHIPVVMMTAAYVSVEDAEKGTELGADEYVIKPFLREVLIHNVERLLPDAARADNG